jgi:hypothetical protein
MQYKFGLAVTIVGLAGEILSGLMGVEVGGSIILIPLYIM